MQHDRKKVKNGKVNGPLSLRNDWEGMSQVEILTNAWLK